MEKYMMDSNAPPQSRGTPLQVKGRKSKGQGRFDFARGTPVIANRRSDVDGSVILCPPTGGEEYHAICRISFREKRDRVGSHHQHRVRDRSLLKYRDGPSCEARGDTRWYARGKPPARSEPDDDWNVIPITKPLISPPCKGGVSRPVGTRGLNVIQNDREIIADFAPNKGVRRTLYMLFLREHHSPDGGKPSRKNRWNQ